MWRKFIGHLGLSTASLLKHGKNGSQSIGGKRLIVAQDGFAVEVKITGGTTCNI